MFNFVEIGSRNRTVLYHISNAISKIGTGLIAGTMVS